MRYLPTLLACLPALLAAGAILAAAPASVSSAAPAAKTTIVLCFENTDVLPWRTRQQTGLNFTLLNAVATRLALDFHYQGRPWRRCQDALRSGRVDGSFGMSYTPERAEFAVYPEGTPPNANQRMFRGGYVLVRRRGTSVDYDGTQIIGLTGPIGTEPATSITQDLRRRGYDVDDEAPSPRALLRKLASGRIGAAAVGTDQMNQQWETREPWLQDLEVLPTPLVDKPYFLVFSRSFSASHPGLAAQIWEAVTTVRNSAEYQQALAATRGNRPPPPPADVPEIDSP